MFLLHSTANSGDQTEIPNVGRNHLQILCTDDRKFGASFICCRLRIASTSFDETHYGPFSSPILTCASGFLAHGHVCRMMTCSGVRWDLPRDFMDVLSEVLRVVKLQGAMFYNGEFSAPWSLRSPPSRTLAP